MGDKTKIDWCDSSWNPVSGCLHGCDYCYARGIAKRFEGGNLKPDGKFHMPGVDSSFAILGEKQLIAEFDEPVYRKENDKLKKAPYPYGFYPTLHRYRLGEYEKKKGRVIVVCSMADLFGEWVPDKWIEEVFEACDKAPQHTYLFLTKNPSRYEKLAKKGILRKSNNMWYGTSIINEGSATLGCMMMEFISLKGYNTFASIEPLLGKISDIMCNQITQCFKWVIIGAETGRRKGKVVPQKGWIADIYNFCTINDRPIFMKPSLTEVWGETLIQKFPWKNK